MRFLVGVVSAASIAWVSAALAADGIHWTYIDQTSVAVDWRGCESTIRYGPTPAYGQVASATTPVPLPFSSVGPYREVVLTGLRENAVYHYSIGDGPDHTFRTPPRRGSAGFTAYVQGDIGDSASWWRVAEVQNLIAAGNPDFVLVVGDLTYGNARGQEDVDLHFNDVMKWSQDAAYMPAWGNHEWDSPTDDLRNYKGRFALPNPQTSPNSPALGCCGEDWYWFDYGNVRFIAYPEPYGSATWPDWYAKASSLMDEAQADPDITFIVTFGHRPAYSSGHHPGMPVLKAYLDGLGASHSKYVLNLNGHSHNYERSHPQNGVVHITSGTGGSNLEQESGGCLWAGGCPPPAWSAFRAMRHVAVRLRFGANAIEGVVYCGPPGDSTNNINDLSCTPGEVVDSFVIGNTPAVSTFYVDNGNPTCSDAGPGTETEPYCTISAALGARAAPGATILVRPGLYRERVVVPVSGAASNPLVLRADGGPVVLDGADDYSSVAQWVPYSGDVWLAPAVTWSPGQVFVDGSRLTSSGGSPGALPAGAFAWVKGRGLAVNVGGGNPGLRQILVGRRGHGFLLSGKSWVTIDGFTVARAEDRGFQLSADCSHVVLVRDTVEFSGRHGIHVDGGADITIESSRISDNRDHGIALVAGVTASTIRDCEVSRNGLSGSPTANGIHLSGSPGNELNGNRAHDNRDSGLQVQIASNDCVFIHNRSWNNEDHGYDHLGATGALHVGDVAGGNRNHGFAVQGGSTGTRIYNSIATDNGLAAGRFDLLVDVTSAIGLDSDYNVFWNSTGQPPIQYAGVAYAQLPDFTAASGQDARSIQADPRFVDPAAGDFRLSMGSPAIDAGDSGVPGWVSTDAEGLGRVDDLSAFNSGGGPTRYADRGAHEFQPPLHAGAITATPATGVEPLMVTLDASGSVDPDGAFVSYEFDFGDGRLLVAQPQAVVSHLYPAGTWTATVVAMDGLGYSASASVPIVVAPAAGEPNLVGNPSFESNTAGWAAYSGSSIQRVAGGFDGGYALRVTGPNSTAIFGVNDSPNAVSGTTAGTRYRYAAWVRSSGGGGQVRLRVQEWLGGAAVAPRVESPPVRLSCMWQTVAIEVEAQLSGSNFDLQLVDSPLGPGETFLVDNISIRIAGPPVTAVLGDSLALAPLVPTLAPNPVRERATLRFATSRPGPLRVEIYDVAGRRVRTLMEQGRIAPGVHQVPIDGRGDGDARLGSGLYFYRITAGEGSVTGRFLVVR